ncbi:MAG: DUF2490 domain-containing protein [Candidatus Neomarinimicrobiota bacterium]|nr:MAG: DUF2490 domain-containing protein [Candidatus Neomarinimicrobiota bacterium]
MKRILRYTFLFLVLVPEMNPAQTMDEFWTSLTLSTALNARWELSLRQGLRYRDPLPTFKKTYTEGTAERTLNPAWKLSLGFRYSWYGDKTTSRSFGTLKWKQKRNHCKIQYRCKIQSEWQGNSSSELTIRNRGRWKGQPAKRWEPILALETFHRVEPQSWVLSRLRCTVTGRTRLGGYILDLEAILQWEDWNENKTNRVFITGIELARDF